MAGPTGEADKDGGRRSGYNGGYRLASLDGPVRDEVAEGASAATAEDDRSRHGFEREPDLWRARRKRLQWPFRLHLLSPAICLQPARRCRAVCSTTGQRAQCRQLARDAGAGGNSLASLFPRRCGFGQSRDIRVP